MARTRPALAAALVTVAAAAACSSAPAPAAAPPPPTRDPAAACRALAAFDAATVAYPGGDPTSPPPSADEVKAWAGTAVGPIGDLATTVPVELDPAVATLRKAVEGTEAGTPVNTEDTAITGASTALDKWAHDSCGFPTLDVTGTGTDLPGVPASFPAGPLSISFTNGGAPEKAGFVLLVAKVKDGAQYTLDGIRDGSVDFTSVADVVGAAQPTAETPTAYTVATLTPGKFLVVSPIGAPPEFTGTVATESRRADAYQATPGTTLIPRARHQSGVRESRGSP